MLIHSYEASARITAKASLAHKFFDGVSESTINVPLAVSTVSATQNHIATSCEIQADSTPHTEAVPSENGTSSIAPTHSHQGVPSEDGTSSAAAAPTVPSETIQPQHATQSQTAHEAGAEPAAT